MLLSFRHEHEQRTDLHINQVTSSTSLLFRANPPASPAITLTTSLDTHTRTHSQTHHRCTCRCKVRAVTITGLPAAAAPFLCSA